MLRTELGKTRTEIAGRWTLPPLILHPFSGEKSADRILEGSQAALMLNGIMPHNGKDREQLEDLVVSARIHELRMLYFLGKDVMRWMEQCVDFIARTPELSGKGIREQSFAALITEHTPEELVRKLVKWGVTDPRAVFSRAIGITSVLTTPPSFDILTRQFIESYHRFVDYLYVCYQNLQPFSEIATANFHVDIFASAEYTEMLTKQWNAVH